MVAAMDQARQSAELADSSDAVLGSLKLLSRRARRGDAPDPPGANPAAARRPFTRPDADFLAALAHEVLTPVASLRASVEVLADDLADIPREDALSLLRRMQHNVGWIASLMDNLRTSSRLAAGQLDLRREEVALDQCVEIARAVVQVSYERKGQQLEVRGLQSAPSVIGDRRAIIHILVNLLTNASKYSPARSRVHLDFDAEHGWARVRVSDNGPGVPADEQRRIFEPYARGHEAIASGSRGLGIGLHIVKELVERQGGSVGLDSRPGEGASFWFSLPCRRALAG